MKKLYLLFLFCSITTLSFAQLPDGSTAPNWTLTDLNGTSHTLYDVLDQDISAIIDFSATWCGPCWNYHQTGRLDDLYEKYGPTGTVEADKVRVYWIESDDATNDACMTGSAGCTGGTQGDWTAGTLFPLFNPPNETVPTQYAIGAYPTILAVCPDRKLFDIGQPTTATLESWVLGSCPMDDSYVSVDEVCFNDGSGMIDLTVTAGAGNLNYEWSNGAETEDLIGIGQGTYSCTITDGNGRSIETPEITVTGQTSGIQVNSSAVNTVTCAGNADGSISVSASGGGGNHTYQWSNGATGPSVSSLGPDNYTVVITDADGCSKEESFVVTEPLPLSETINTLPETCENDNGTIILQASGGTGPFNYNIGVDNNSSGIFQNVPGGDYVVEITDANGCSTGSFPLTVESVPGPQAQAASPGGLSCANSTIQLNGAGSTEGSLMIYNWTTSDGNIVSGGNTLNPTIDQPGTYMIEVTDGQTNCTEVATVVVGGNFDTPMADAGSNQALDCVVTEVNLDGTNSDSGSNITYQWETSDGNILSGDDSAIATVNGAGTYTLVVTNTESGCSSTSSVEVSQSAEVPVSDAGQMQAITCDVTQVILDGSASSSGDEYTYTWKTNDGEIIEGETSPTTTVNEPGVYVLEVLNNENGCLAISSVEVVMNTQAPDGTIDEPQILTCTMESQTLNYEIDGSDYTVSWTTTDGSIVSGDETLQPVVDAPGTYMIEITNNENGCSSTSSVEVTESINTPVAGYNYNADKFDFTFSDMSQGEPSDYLWDFGDGNTSMEQNPSHVYAETGDFEVCLTITNECGDNTTCETVTVVGGASLNVQDNLSNPTCNGKCDGTASIVTEEEIENYSISISGPDGFASDEFNLTDLCPGTYDYTVTNDADETVDGQFVITEPEEIQLSTSEVINVACHGDASGVISVEFTGGTGDLELTWNNNATGSEISELTAGTYSVMATDENGCQESMEFIVEEPLELELIESDVLDITDSNPEGSIDITVKGGTPGYSFLWTNGDETEDITGLEEGEYSVDVTDENGCVTTFGPFVVNSIIAVTEIESLEKIALTPNPARSEVAISLDFSKVADVNISLINNIGQVVNSVSKSGDNIVHRMNLDNYSSGLYFVKVSVNNQTTVRKLIIE